MAARRSKLSPEQIADNKRIMEAKQAVLEAFRNNKCPTCGRKVVRNLSISGWVQCSQFGSPMFRVEPDNPPCAWQGFYL